MPADNTVFSVQCFFSTVVMAFCIGMLADDRDPSYYLPILTSLIGYWLPAPRGTSAAPMLPQSIRDLPNLMMRRNPSVLPRRDSSAPAGDEEMEAMEAGSLRRAEPS